MSRAHCPWMAMNGLRQLARVLETGDNEIRIDEEHPCAGCQAYSTVTGVR
ncbi:MAG: hypothetical protein R3F37_12090 [Candidatus Competibacteraceae bacterium]